MHVGDNLLVVQYLRSGLFIENENIAAKMLSMGGLVAFPTETVYGLGANIDNEDAVLRIFEIKDRPKNNPLITHVETIQDAELLTHGVQEYAYKIMETFWPGPVTLILPKSKSVSTTITSNQNSIGIRVPRNEKALKLIRSFKKLGGRGIAAPSANIFNSVSPTDYFSVYEELGGRMTLNLDGILLGDSSEIGIESTIIDCLGIIPRILRPGQISEVQISELLDLKIERKSITRRRVSGNHNKHYSPKAIVSLNQIPKSGQGYIHRENEHINSGVVSLGKYDSLEELARILYASFRKADRLGLREIIVQIDESEESLYEAILDRVLKASYKK